MSSSAPSNNGSTLLKLRALNLSSRLRDNDCPTADAAQLTKLLSDASKELADYECEISRLRILLADLDNKKNELEKHILHGKTLFSPVRKLPNEVLSQIFHWHGTKVFASDKPELPDALRLSRVCSRWRAILSHSMFWRTIVLNFHPDTDRQAFVVQEALSRSSGLTLNVTFQCLRVVQTVSPALDMLLRESHRWQRVTFHMPLSARLFEQIHRKLPSLEALSLDPYYSADITDPITLFDVVPSLHSLRLGPLSPDTFQLPWKQLKRLDCYGLAPAQVSKALSLASGLVKAAIRPYYSRLKDEGSTPFAMESSLSSLIFELDSEEAYEYFEKLCSMLTASKLNDLTLYSRGDIGRPSDDFRPFKFASFLSRSCCTLTSLSLVNVNISALRFRQLCELVPTLTNLRLHETYRTAALTADVVNAMNPNLVDKRSTSPLLPRLCHIDFNCTVGIMLNPIINMIQARWRPDFVNDEMSCIRSVQLKFLSGQQEPLPMLDKMRSDGLAISVTFSTQNDYVLPSDLPGLPLDS